jgi:hypothetical protein
MRRNVCRFVLRASECHQIADSGASRTVGKAVGWGRMSRLRAGGRTGREGLWAVGLLYLLLYPVESVAVGVVKVSVTGRQLDHGNHRRG